MEREPSVSFTTLNDAFGERLPYTHFYRFLQWLEKTHPEYPPLGSSRRIGDDPVRLRPYAGMGFPAGEFKGIEINPDDNPDSPPTVRTTFMGLYGITSPLPTQYIDDITQRREGHETVEHFLDIFNHRLITQYYRIWRKHSYPASFEDGGTDAISQCLLGLAGLGIPGTAEHLDTPLSRFLGMLPALQVPGRTAEGVAQVVKMVTPDTTATVLPHHKRRVEVPELTLSTAGGFCLGDHLVLGGVATDVNGTIDIRLYTESKADLQGWFPPDFTLYNDLLALLRVYLGWRYDAHISLTFPRRLLPRPRLTCQYSDDSVYMGYSCLLGHDPDDMTPDPAMPDRLTVSLGYYEGLQKNPQHREVTDVEE
ncbi:type VI secretion system baseplate subunit TssG [Salmonella enterica]|uniref:Type VI secretion system baseplate subunit TssG n=1 Tax=Salmonella diarizonae TaxID=59204 RepID=A0A5Y3VL19_SALDZ|nr:type VI secretion system baseplate subunit TssG [Salmonella enterica]EAS9239268.1 type VI secretion system baseplate subunit TssG [Salmonella enterica subsp. enterica]EAW1321327.1 type VI secretion system baseplate subunit TssG [Salmonella enterica subsp. diarizonae]EBE3722464.1 type VI secretion system baseplate subunit TssG [Salmonella enterica subsp. diarizonae serovar 42:l,v:1,5,7]EBH8064866.1 type VI secretion system baseplate subunit TssG [Salmonella bongori]EBH8355332.1 type VI secre